MAEYITKQQAIDLAESMRNLMAKGVADAFIKGIEGVDGFEAVASDRCPNGVKIIVIHKPTKEKGQGYSPSKSMQISSSI